MIVINEICIDFLNSRIISLVLCNCSCFFFVHYFLRTVGIFWDIYSFSRRIWNALVWIFNSFWSTFAINRSNWHECVFLLRWCLYYLFIWQVPKSYIFSYSQLCNPYHNNNNVLSLLWISLQKGLIKTLSLSFCRFTHENQKKKKIPCFPHCIALPQLFEIS